MGIEDDLVVDAVGFSGGIWLLWNSSYISIEEKDRSSQHLHVSVEQGTTKWMFTAVYGNPALIQRRGLWTSMRDIAEDIAGPWLVAGDFNSILCAAEKLGGAPFDASRVRDFQDCVLDTGLIDMGFSGPPFTWFHAGKKERLDRGMANATWHSAFPESSVQHLPKIKSDHRPLLIHTNASYQPAGPKPYRFLAAWLMHEDFKGMAEQAWSQGTYLKSSIEAFTTATKAWNHHTFGHVIRRKNSLLAKIERLEMAGGGDSDTPRLKQYRQELEDTLLQEAILWCQKSRLD
ncbi:unnamed protein product [Linum trigynum]|uniref:Endonuclease/exonuclease/phosphatase domain-containing protein n=1 Tax=Linum trigynum TaxID=586398 RepID=A0AAV2ERU5_9ROSI